MTLLRGFPIALLLLAACGGGKSRGEERAESAPPVRTLAAVYPRPAGDVWDAAVDAAKALDLRIDDDRHDRAGGVLVARRATGDRVLVQVRGLDAQRTEATVKTESDVPDLARRIQDRIAGALKTAPQRVH